MHDALFVTGASGFVGRCFLRGLPSGRYREVRALVRDPERLAGDVRDRADLHVVPGDLTEGGAWEAALEGATHVVHLAAVTGKARPAAYRRVHVEGTERLLAAALRAQPEGLLHVSTIAVSFPDQTRYFYAHTKRRAEELVAASGLPYTILRPTMIAGPGAPVLEGLAKLARGMVMPVFGRGTVRVQPIHVEDVAALLTDLLAEARFASEVIEAGGPEVLSIEALLQHLRRERFGRSPRTVHLPLRLIRRVLCLLEPLFLPLLPFTAGQLATFANDGTAAPHPFVAERVASMRALEHILAERDDA